MGLRSCRLHEKKHPSTPEAVHFLRILARTLHVLENMTLILTFTAGNLNPTTDKVCAAARLSSHRC